MRTAGSTRSASGSRPAPPVRLADAGDHARHGDRRRPDVEDLVGAAEGHREGVELVRVEPAAAPARAPARRRRSRAAPSRRRGRGSAGSRRRRARSAGSRRRPPRTPPRTTASTAPPPLREGLGAGPGGQAVAGRDHPDGRVGAAARYAASSGSSKPLRPADDRRSTRGRTRAAPRLSRSKILEPPPLRLRLVAADRRSRPRARPPGREGRSASRARPGARGPTARRAPPTPARRPPRPAGPARTPLKFAATTVTQTWPDSSGSMVAPKMMLASGSAASATTRAASLTSTSDRSGPPVTPSRMPRGPVDGRLEERRGDRRLGGLGRPVAPARVPDAEQRRARAADDGPHVGEVEVDEARQRDQVADALHALAQQVVADLEGLDHAGARAPAPPSGGRWG